MPETVEESHALSYDEVKSKMNDENNLREVRPLFFTAIEEIKKRMDEMCQSVFESIELYTKEGNA